MVNCFVTGHRRVHLGHTSRYLAKLTDLAIAHGATRFYTGMALGTDQLAALEWTRRGSSLESVNPLPRIRKSLVKVPAAGVLGTAEWGRGNPMAAPAVRDGLQPPSQPAHGRGL